MFEWHKYICEYYNVTPEEALELGTRKTGRKPNLPGSSTCSPVSGKTFEDIWTLKERETEQQIFEFYKDQGAWSSFRQCVRHKDMINLHVELLSKTIKNNSTFCEYGCGVAPFTYTLLQAVDPEVKLNIYISDVECEHFTFGEWRLKRLIEDRNLKNISLESKPVLPNLLPKYEKKIDVLFIFEVLEHVPSPLSTIKNITESLNQNGLLCENFIKHQHVENDLPGPDLESAAQERDKYYNFLRQNFNLLLGSNDDENPNQTRIWRKI